MTKRYRAAYADKSFSENLNPLYGLIRKNVGRKWDDFYSELCEVFDKRSVINQHILDHLEQKVMVKTILGEDGKIYYVTRWKGVIEVDTEYFVHPTTGILQKNVNFVSHRQKFRKAEELKKQEEEKICKVIDSNTKLQLIDGVWFIVTYAKTPAEFIMRSVSYPWDKGHTNRTYKIYTPVYDVVLKDYVKYGLKKEYAVSKRTASKKELKQHGVK